MKHELNMPQNMRELRELAEEVLSNEKYTTVTPAADVFVSEKGVLRIQWTTEQELRDLKLGQLRLCKLSQETDIFALERHLVESRIALSLTTEELKDAEAN